MLGADFGVDPRAVQEAARQYAAGPPSPPPDELNRRTLRQLQTLERTLVPPHATLFATLSQLPDGMQFILQLRADVLVCAAAAASVRLTRLARRV